MPLLLSQVDGVQMAIKDGKFFYGWDTELSQRFRYKPDDLIEYLRGRSKDRTELDCVAADEIQRLSAEGGVLKGLLREWRKAEWMVTHDWGGDRDALHKKTLAALGEPDDGSYDPEPASTGQEKENG